MTQNTGIPGVLAALCLLTGLALAEEMTLNVNVKKPVAVVSDKFLSVTVDPTALFSTDILSDVVKSTSMAKALSPAYVRIGGPRSNSYVFERDLYPKEARPDPGYTFTEANWISVHQWAQRAGLEVIACIAPQQADTVVAGVRSSAWDPRNALDLISFSDHMGYNTSWQLGYECQTRCEATGAEMGRDVQRLRNMLDAFPRYAERGLVAGPDVVTYKTRQQQQYLQEYFGVANAALSAITWHPEFAGVTVETEGVSMHHDGLALEKDAFYRVVGRQAGKKPLWIAESRPEECKRQFLGALVWARRLGNSARLGIQVLMRQPEASDLFSPTPDYWVSVLHKFLVGREVLDTKVAAGNRTHVHFYCQCTKPSSRYERGSLTIFGINLTPAKVTATIKGLKLKLVHKYILLPGYDAPNRMFAESVLLNNEMLNLVDGKEVPDLEPAISNGERGVKLKLPSGGIGFWVLPNLKIKTCMGSEEETTNRNLLRRALKRMEEVELEDDEEYDIADTVEMNEERKSGLRTTPKRLHRISRHRLDERDDLEGRRLRRLDGTRHDFERLEKIMRKRDHHSVSPKSGNQGGSNRGIFENSEEIDDRDYQKGQTRRTINGQKVDSSEVLRVKLQEYKKRLAEHENRKKQRETDASDMIREYFKDDPNAFNKSTDKFMETAKVIEALALITKVESAMKGLEKEVDIENRTIAALSTLGAAADQNDVTTNLQQSTSSPVTDPLLDEVLNTEKAKRTTIPARIEDQLRALYHLLSEEKDKKVQPTSRQRRDLDKRIVDDIPPSLRRDGIFLRKRTKAEEVKDRLAERINERRQRLRSRQGFRRHLSEDDSSENNFYGFQHREPLKNFPQGDVYLETGGDSLEAKDAYGFYIDSNNQGAQQQLRRPWKRSDVTPVEDNDNEEVENRYLPNEFYENINKQKYQPKENANSGGELWEAEAPEKEEETEKDTQQTDDYENQEIVTESPLSELEDRKEKEKTAEKLVKYYQISTDDEQDDFEHIREKHQQDSDTEDNDDTTTPHHRSKRHINDLEYVLHQEMISQDDNNLRDCQCRVIRGIQLCKDCEEHWAHDIKIPSAIKPITRNSLMTTYNKPIRFRRDVDEVEVVDANDEASESDVEEITIAADTETEEISTDEKSDEIAETTNTQPELEDSKELTNVEEEVTVNTEDRLKLDTENDDKISANRLPRKIESTTKFFLKSKKTPAPTIKEILERSKKMNSNDAMNVRIGGLSTSGNESQAVNQFSNKRSIVEATTQVLTTIVDQNTSKLPKETVDPKQSFLAEAPIVPKTDINIRSITEKKIENIDFKGKDAAVKRETTETLILPTIASIVNSKTKPSVTIDSTLRDTTLNSENKISITSDKSNNKAKDNSTLKNEDSVKTRQARLTTRAEALAALRKENESRRAKKMIEASMKLLDNENARFEEYQRRRQEQLKRLKMKLRAKREKMLQQYREELIEAINDSSELKERRLRRRDVFDKYQNSNYLPKNDDIVTTTEKVAFLMRYRPIRISKNKDRFNSDEDEYVPVVEIMTPYQAAGRRLLSISTSSTIQKDNNNHENMTSEDKQNLPTDQLKEEAYEYDTNNEQESRSKNIKRSPYNASEKVVVNKRNGRKKTSSLGDSGEYYTQEQNFHQPTEYHLPSHPQSQQYSQIQQPDEQKLLSNRQIQQPQQQITHFIPAQVQQDQLNQPQQQNTHYQEHQQSSSVYYPSAAYNEKEIVPLQKPYAQQPDIQTHQIQLQHQPEQSVANLYQMNPSYVQKQPLKTQYNPTPTNESPLEYTNLYNVNQKINQPKNYYNFDQYTGLQQPEDRFYDINQEIAREEQQPLDIYYNPLNDEYIDHEPLDQNYRKSKRSSLKFFEIDPSMYEEDEPDYDLQDFFVRPSFRFSTRSYRHDPFAYDNKRLKRDAITHNTNENLDGPLSFSLGLKKTKSIQKKSQNIVVPDNFNRRKRVANQFLDHNSESNLQTGSKINKNIKKVYQDRFDNKFKKFMNLYDTPSDSINAEEIREKSFNVDYSMNENTNRKDLLKRHRRFSDDDYNTYNDLTDNSIHRSDPEMDELWNNLIEINEDEQLLKEYDRQKDQMINNFRDSELYIKVNNESTSNLPIMDMKVTKPVEYTTQTNIESMIVEAIPKIQSVITGGLEKAKNITGTLEDFFENFDKFDTTENVTSGPEFENLSEENDGNISRNVFQTMVGGVRKFFGLVSGIAKIFYGH